MFFVMLCALVGYVVTFLVLENNLTGNPNLSGIKSVRVLAGGDSSVFNVIPMDSVLINGAKSTGYVATRITDSLFNRNPVFMMWSQLIIIMVSITAGAFPVFVWQLAEIKRSFDIHARQVFMQVAMALVLCISLAAYSSTVKGLYSPINVVADFKILFSAGWIPKAIVGVTLLLLVPIVAVIFIIVPAAGHISITKNSKESYEKAAYRIDRLNKILAGALQVLAIIVVFSVLTSSALMESIKATVRIKDFDIFPRQECYVYGLFFASFLGIVYVPVQIFLKQRSDRIRESLNYFYDAETVKDDKWFDRISGLININSSSFDNLKLTFTVLSPLITSFLPEVLKMSQ